MNQEDMKHCNNCGKLISINDLYNYKSKDVLWCETCANNQYNNWKAQNVIEETIEIKEKRCSICKHVKPAKEFYKDRTSRTGLQSCCKNCSNKKVMMWRKQNIKHTREYAKNWQRVKRQSTAST